MLTPKVKFVEYNERHKEALCQMIYNLYTEDPEGEPMEASKIEATIAYAKSFRDNLRIYIFEAGDTAAGYAIVQLIWSNEWGGLTANIDEMYVAASHRGKGYATDFIRNVNEIIPGINRITLEVTPSNDSGMKFYKDLGFRQAENRFMELCLDL